MITKIDTENAINSENGGYFYSGSEETRSSKYPFYIELDNSEGLILGQHVYVEPDLGQNDEDGSPGIWLAGYMVDQSDPDHPFVWKDVNGRLRKQEVAVDETREEIGKVRITEGLTIEDSICMPEEGLKEGMKTLPMSEKPAEETEDVYEEGMEEGYEGDERHHDEHQPVAQIIFLFHAASASFLTAVFFLGFGSLSVVRIHWINEKNRMISISTSDIADEKPVLPCSMPCW